jgi:phosphohistidine phosphatase
MDNKLPVPAKGRLMRLYLVQHGEAKPREEDSDRPLTEKGRADLRAVIDMLGRDAFHVDRILHSGKTRARQTAEILAERLKPSRGLAAADGLDPLADPAAWVRRLRGDDRTLMLVGHLPHLAKLTGLLVSGDPASEVVIFRRGAILCLERGNGGRWLVQWLVIPGLVQPTG